MRGCGPRTCPECRRCGSPGPLAGAPSGGAASLGRWSAVQVSPGAGQYRGSFSGTGLGPPASRCPHGRPAGLSDPCRHPGRDPAVGPTPEVAKWVVGPESGLCWWQRPARRRRPFWPRRLLGRGRGSGGDRPPLHGFGERSPAGLCFFCPLFSPLLLMFRLLL